MNDSIGTAEQQATLRKRVARLRNDVPGFRDNLTNSAVQL